MSRPHTREELELFTEDQLNYLEESRRGSVFAAAKESARRQRNQGAIAFSLLLAGLIFLFADQRANQAETQDAIVKSGRVVAVEGCNRDFVDAQKFRGLLERLNNSTRANYRLGRTTEEQYQAAQVFYNRELATFSLPDCRSVQSIVTSDPTDLPNRVAPYFPGNPNNPAPPRP